MNSIKERQMGILEKLVEWWNCIPEIRFLERELVDAHERRENLQNQYEILLDSRLQANAAAQMAEQQIVILSDLVKDRDRIANGMRKVRDAIAQAYPEELQEAIDEDKPVLELAARLIRRMGRVVPGKESAPELNPGPLAVRKILESEGRRTLSPEASLCLSLMGEGRALAVPTIDSARGSWLFRAGAKKVEYNHPVSEKTTQEVVESGKVRRIDNLDGVVGYMLYTLIQ